MPDAEYNIITKPDKILVAYCGLYCEDCFSYSRHTAHLSRDLKRSLREQELKENSTIIPYLDKELYKKYMVALQSINELRCEKKTCLAWAAFLSIHV